MDVAVGRALLVLRQMKTVTFNAEVGQVSAELVRRGIAADTRVHVLVEVTEAEELSVAAIAQAGGAFDWLEAEPELYSDADLIERVV